MNIILKNNNTLIFNEFQFRCCVGKKGITKKKVEGDKKTPKGIFSLGPIFYRSDRNKKPLSKIKLIEIKKNMGWCNDINNSKYNKLIKIKENIKHERMHRKDKKYDFVLLIKYNFINPIKNKGSAIFIHCTKNFKGTLGCVALKKSDLLILIKLINKNTKIEII